MLRGLAALLVLCSHLRNYVFADFGSLAASGPLTKGFYAATSVGHVAVIVFFAMSGFLVGGKALRDLLAGKWSWRLYLLRRSSRLLIVAGPALVLTYVLDHAGMALTGGAGYAGAAVERYASWPVHQGALAYSWTTFLGNLGFLQTIAVPIFGTNGPTWSLANEFWYYLVFPLAAFAVLAREGLGRRGLALALLAACVALLPWPLLVAGSIWVAGAAAAWLVGRERLAPPLRHPASRLLALAIVAVGLGVTRRLPESLTGDLVFGFAVAVALPVAVMLPSFGRLYRTVARIAAEGSYTLYLTHFPFVTLLVMVGLAPYRFQPGPAGALVYAGLLVAALAWAAAVWWCFERNTDRLFRRLAGWLVASPGRAASRQPAVPALVAVASPLPRSESPG